MYISPIYIIVLKVFNIMMERLNKKISRLVSAFSPKLHFYMAYYHHRHRWPNLIEPKDLSELWIRRLLDGGINHYYTLADKYLVREYVRRCGCEDMLPGLIGCYSKGNELDFEMLPQKFALKANWGAGMNLICTDKSKYSEAKLRNMIDSWLAGPKYAFSERHYNLIDRKVVCEEFIDDGTGGFPIDYKFICLKGEVKAILVCNDRDSGHADYIPYDINWNPLYDYCIAKHDSSELVNKPNNLSEMIASAKKLASSIDMVRVDLYSNGTKIWFGEMTLTPDGCIFRRWTQRAIDEMGNYFRTH